MPMRKDFCAFILTHGRPDRVHTYKTLMRAGYTGKVFIVIDDEDKTADEYRKRFGDKVLQFCKAEVAAKIDEGDNFDDRRAIIYARNACWDLARQVGCKYFIQLDDDYTFLRIRIGNDGVASTTGIAVQLDYLFSELVKFYASASRIASLAVGQGGDFIGGGDGKDRRLTRKAMNTFICSIDRPFRFFGRINEDVNAYTCGTRRGDLFLTVMQVQMNQVQTQSSQGGMTELYLDGGTYLKTFYTVMYAPSCVKVGQIGDPRNPHWRIHHKINWAHTAPKILREICKKAPSKTKAKP